MRKRKTAWKSDAALCCLGILCAGLAVKFAITKISDTTAAPGLTGMEHFRIFAMPSNGSRLPGKPGEQPALGHESEFDPIVTGSIRPTVGVPTASASGRASSRSTEGAPQAANLNAYALQGVFDGKALLQGPFGYLLVSSGDTIPGIGRIQSIQSRGGNWIVQTPLGNLESGK